jgi:hypothetical protein
MLTIHNPMFLAAHDGHVFAVTQISRHALLVTNENACQTRISIADAKRILGGDFKLARWNYFGWGN